MEKRYTNKDIMKRLDEIEKNNKNISIILLFYSLAVALLIGYSSTQNILYIFFGVVCYAVGILLSIFRGIKLWYY